jgi:hypothetical protein
MKKLQNLFSKLYLLTYSVVLVELWPPHIFDMRFREIKFLQGGVIPTPNPQPGGPGYLLVWQLPRNLSAWVALPAAMLPQA